MVLAEDGAQRQLTSTPCPCTRPLDFCGKDGFCHPLNCANFYQYGNPFFSGANHDFSLDPLQCQTIAPSEEVPMAVLLGCKGEPFTESSDGFPHLRHNEVCWGQPALYHYFTCFQNNYQVTDSVVHQFEGSSLPPYGCEADETPEYHYVSHAVRVDDRHGQNGNGTIHYETWESFNTALARATMYIRLDVSETGGLQPFTRAPVDPSTTAPMASPSSRPDGTTNSPVSNGAAPGTGTDPTGSLQSGRSSVSVAVIATASIGACILVAAATLLYLRRGEEQY